MKIIRVKSSIGEYRLRKTAGEDIRDFPPYSSGRYVITDAVAEKFASDPGGQILKTSADLITERLTRVHQLLGETAVLPPAVVKKLMNAGIEPAAIERCHELVRIHQIVLRDEAAFLLRAD